MSSEEQLVLYVIGKVFSGQFDRETARQVLNVSERTLARYIRGYKDLGRCFLSTVTVTSCHGIKLIVG